MFGKPILFYLQAVILRYYTFCLETLLTQIIFIKNSGEQFAVDLSRSGKYIIGRSPESDISINDHLVSREHCLLEVSDDGVFLKDLKSSNGVFINSKKVTKHHLLWGDKVNIGNTELTFYALESQVKKPPEISEGSTFVVNPAEINISAILLSQFSSEYLRILNYIFVLSQNQPKDILNSFFDVFKSTFSQFRCKLFSESFSEILSSVRFEHTDEIFKELSEKKPYVLINNTGYFCYCGTIFYGEQPAAYLYADTKDSNLKLSQLDLNLLSLICSLIGNIIREKTEKKDLIREISQTHIIIGDSNFTKKLKDQISKLKDLDTNVLITGETGTGKEVVARNIHCQGKRAPKPFIAINCSAIPKDLFESEFFGHMKGSFTGASTDNSGYLESSGSGTLFLDEISEMPLDLQAKLLRVLETRTFRRIGDTRDRPFRGRLICATNKNLEKQVENSKFRKDLHYRIRVVEIVLLSLKQHPEDIEPLISYYLDHFSIKMSKTGIKLEKDALVKLKNYSWPGNIRELKNIIESAIIRSSGSSINTDSIQFLHLESGGDLSLDSIIKVHIEKILQMTGGNKKEAAKILGISRANLYEKLS